MPAVLVIAMIMDDSHGNETRKGVPFRVPLTRAHCLTGGAQGIGPSGYPRQRGRHPLTHGPGSALGEEGPEGVRTLKRPRHGGVAPRAALRPDRRLQSASADKWRGGLI